ncbi:hypothetical protein [Ancylobacter sp. IITR112]|uniref:hypothetical protein n=1 Tax=Ancylobacter sp. IITR112 TaxID=3138073 RepID=UPI00352AC4FB
MTRTAAQIAVDAARRIAAEREALRTAYEAPSAPEPAEYVAAPEPLAVVDIVVTDDATETHLRVFVEHVETIVLVPTH